MKNTFTAIDFETATPDRNSICQIGLIRVEQGIITQELSNLVQPPNNHYWKRFTFIHGISAIDTANAPAFNQVWQTIEPFINNQKVVAHNGFAFDFPVMEKTLQHYQIALPNYEKECTYKMYRNNLAALCAEFSIPLKHHDALSDAKACAELYLRYVNLF